MSIKLPKEGKNIEEFDFSLDVSKDDSVFLTIKYSKYKRENMGKKHYQTIIYLFEFIKDENFPSSSNLKNLISNIMRYSKSGHVKFTEWTVRAYLEVEVKDTKNNEIILSTSRFSYYMYKTNYYSGYSI